MAGGTRISGSHINISGIYELIYSLDKESLIRLANEQYEGLDETTMSKFAEINTLAQDIGWSKDDLTRTIDMWLKKEGLKGVTQKKDKAETGDTSKTVFEEGNLYNVDLSLILIPPAQVRKPIEEKTLEELSSSIRERGLLQPVLLRQGENGEIFLVAGERRYRASMMAGLKTIPALFTRGNPLEIAIIENLQRANLTPLEEAHALGHMTTLYNYSQGQLAQAIGKSPSTVADLLTINKLPDSIKEEASNYDLPKNILIDIARQTTTEAMEAMFNKVKERYSPGYDSVDSPAQGQDSTSQNAALRIVAAARELSILLDILDIDSANSISGADKEMVNEELGRLARQLANIQA